MKFTVQSTLNSADGVDDATLRVTGLDPAIDYVVAYELGTTFTGSIASGAAYSTFTDGVVAEYTPSLNEFLLGLAGVSISLLIVTVALRMFHLIPTSLADKIANPHSS